MSGCIERELAAAKMTRLKEALARLDQAVARLEAICAGGTRSGEAGPASARPDAETGWRQPDATDSGARSEGTLIRFDRASGEGEDG